MLLLAGDKKKPIPICTVGKPKITKNKLEKIEEGAEEDAEEDTKEEAEEKADQEAEEEACR